MEKIVGTKLSEESSHVLVNEYYDFRHAKSIIIDNLILYIYLMNIVATWGQIDAIYTDQQKVFDKVGHSLFLSKLGKSGFKNPFPLWINSYLNNRTQKVKLYACICDILKVSSGVLHGGHLSLFLFLLFVNDGDYCLKTCQYVMFANYMKIFTFKTTMTFLLSNKI